MTLCTYLLTCTNTPTASKLHSLEERVLQEIIGVLKIQSNDEDIILPLWPVRGTANLFNGMSPVRTRYQFLESNQRGSKIDSRNQNQAIALPAQAPEQLSNVFCQ